MKVPGITLYWEKQLWFSMIHCHLLAFRMWKEYSLFIRSWRWRISEITRIIRLNCLSDKSELPLSCLCWQPDMPSESFIPQVIHSNFYNSASITPSTVDRSMAILFKRVSSFLSCSCPDECFFKRTILFSHWNSWLCRCWPTHHWAHVQLLWWMCSRLTNPAG